MFHRIIDWAVNNRLMVVLALISLAVGAAVLLPRLNLDAFPDVTNIQVAVNTEAPGLAAEEVEQLISFPIESVMYALPDVTEVRSISKSGLSIVTVVFAEGTDIYFARQLVFERLQAARELIPEGVGTPEMGPNSSGLGQVYQYLLHAEPDSGYDTMALRGLNDWLVSLMLMPVEGVTDVLSFGGEVRQYQIKVNPSRLLAYELNLDQLASALERNNENAGGWYINRGQEQLVIRGVGWIRTGKDGLNDLARIPVKTLNGAVVYLRDVAQIALGAEIRQGAVTMTRRDAQGNPEPLGEVVTGIVLKRMGANTKAAIDGIKQRLPLIQQALPPGVSLQPFYDQAELIGAAVNTVVRSLLLAFVFILLVLMLFLMNLRATLLVLVSIPISIAMALLLMAWFGLSANLMSLGGLAVAIGMLVDGAVVMVENLFKHLARHEASSADTTAAGLRTLIRQAGYEVARPIFFATTIVLLVFIPLYSFEGVEAKLFEPMATSIILAMLTAVAVALIVVPALASYLFKRSVKQRANPALDALQAFYARQLRNLMHRPKTVAAVCVVLLLLTAAVVPRLGTEFVPELEEGTLNLRVTLAPSASLETALEVAPKLESMLLEFPEVTYALSRIGRPEIGGDPEPVSNIEIYIGLKPADQWQNVNSRAALQTKMQARLEQFPGLLFNFSQPIATRVDELLSGVKAQLAIKLFGPGLDRLASLGKELESLVKQIPGASDVALEPVVGEAQLIVEPDRTQLSRFGLSVADVMALVRDGLGGRAIGQVIQGNERYDIYLRLAPDFRDSLNAIRDLRIQTPSRAWVRLGDVARIEIATGPPQIRRDNVQRRVVVQANVAGRDMGNLVADIQAAIQTRLDLPAGYSVEIGGQFENQQRAQKRLLWIVPLSLAVIALLLFIAFGSAGQALLILINIPLAVIGGVFALYFSGQYLSVPGAVGFITLFSVAVLNGVVLVSSINQGLKEGLDPHRAILEGATSRLRPVLMTAITSALGLIPMLLASGTGAEIQRPLATVIVGGLVSATLLTLIVLPCLFRWFSRAA